jgi:hypothetical protein
MRVAALLLTTAALALGGCGSPASRQPLNESQAAAAGVAPDSETVMKDRWSKLFGNPAAVIAAANEFGYKAPAYKATGGSPAFLTKGTEQVLPETPGPIAVRTNFAAHGAQADHVDAVDFSFDIDVKRKPKSSREADSGRIPTRVIQGFLGRFGVGTGDEIRNAINQRRSDSRTLHGYVISVDVQSLPGSLNADSRRMLVHMAPEGAEQNQDSTARK